MHIDVFSEMDLDGTEDMQFVPKSDFINLFNLTIMNLRDLPVFSTPSEVEWCTKFLISRVHEKILWLDKKYPIHDEYIQ
jgi:hypothetical protein